jgi:predicted hydrocarbon binding protein
MFKLFAKLILHKQIVMKNGEIKSFGQNIVFFPLSNLFYILKLVDKLKKQDELYEMSKQLGKEWITHLLKIYKMDTIEEQAKWGENAFTLAGFGKMQVVNWNVKKKEMRYRVYNSVVARKYGNVGRTVDHIPRGWFAGAASVFFNTDVDCVEVKCLSKGDKFCEFLVAPKKTLKKAGLLKK